MGTKHGPLNERFWPKVDKRGPDECWEWTAGKDKDGYGRIGAGGKGAPMVRAHRVSWELGNGIVPSGMFVLHRCDNPSCVNLAHLFLGTNADNMADRNRKRRHSFFGERNPKTKLTPEQVIAIRQAHGKLSDIGDCFGIKKAQVSAIRNGDSWQHL